MQSVSIFDIFKIGIGPSSSHTLGPWKAAADFISSLPDVSISRIKVTLYGSLSKTGRGHATDTAVQLGLLGQHVETINVSSIPAILYELSATERLTIGGRTLRFVPARDIVFAKKEMPYHPNTLTFVASQGAQEVLKQTYLSVGGGFIQRPEDSRLLNASTLPYPIDTSADLEKHLQGTGASVAELVWQNERSLRSEDEIKRQVHRIFSVMKESVVRGMTTGGTLPGGLHVQRRAQRMSQKLLNGQSFTSFEELTALIRTTAPDFRAVNNWVSCFALAVNEENAAMGRIVTSPTNGAAGVIPAVLLYHAVFGATPLDEQPLLNFFLTAGEIGSLFKKGATISAAVGGCQAEIGVSAAMAAGGLAELLGGTPDQVMMAAEIAMEHHLGLTCDPVGGLVQVPCIERNAMGAMKAITAAHLALDTDPAHCVVHLDTVIKSMWDTAQAMNKKYKETSEGGLAFNIPVALPEC